MCFLNCSNSAIRAKRRSYGKTSASKDWIASQKSWEAPQFATSRGSIRSSWTWWNALGCLSVRHCDPKSLDAKRRSLCGVSSTNDGLRRNTWGDIQDSRDESRSKSNGSALALQQEPQSTPREGELRSLRSLWRMSLDASGSRGAKKSAEGVARL